MSFGLAMLKDAGFGTLFTLIGFVAGGVSAHYYHLKNPVEVVAPAEPCHKAHIGNIQIQPDDEPGPVILGRVEIPAGSTWIRACVWTEGDVKVILPWLDAELRKALKVVPVEDPKIAPKTPANQARSFPAKNLLDAGTEFP